MIDEKSFKKISYIVKSEGEHNASIMSKYPTALEERVKEVLDDNGVKYKFQKLFFKFMEGSRKFIESYYIANFWIPQKKLVLDVEPTTRKVNIGIQGLRTYSNEGITPRHQVLRITEEDLRCPTFVQELLMILK